MKKIFYMLTLIGLCACSSGNICGKWETEGFFVAGAADQQQSAFVAYEKNAVYSFYENGRYEMVNPCKTPPMKVPGLVLREVGDYTYNSSEKKVTFVSDTIDFYVLETDEIEKIIKQRTKELSVVDLSGDKLSFQLDVPSVLPRKAKVIRNMKRVK